LKVRYLRNCQLRRVRSGERSVCHDAQARIHCEDQERRNING
jgi:hypothetical protein